MHSAPSGMRLCPTRVDGAPTLVAHTITLPMCQTRQREHYHKCPTCEHNNNARVNERARAASTNAPAAVPGARKAV